MRPQRRVKPILYQSCYYIGLIDNAVTSIQPYTNMIGWLCCAMVWGERECGLTMYNHNPLTNLMPL